MDNKATMKSIIAKSIIGIMLIAIFAVVAKAGAELIRTDSPQAATTIIIGCIAAFILFSMRNSIFLLIMGIAVVALLLLIIIAIIILCCKGSGMALLVIFMGFLNLYLMPSIYDQYKIKQLEKKAAELGKEKEQKHMDNKELFLIPLALLIFIIAILFLILSTKISNLRYIDKSQTLYLKHQTELLKKP